MILSGDPDVVARATRLHECVVAAVAEVLGAGCAVLISFCIHCGVCSGWNREIVMCFGLKLWEIA